MDIVICPSCRTPVLPKSDGTCPACQCAIGISACPPVDAPEIDQMRVPGCPASFPNSFPRPVGSDPATKPNTRAKWMWWFFCSLAAVAYFLMRRTFRVAGLHGLIPILGGIYATLLANGILPVSANPEQAEAWRRRFGEMMNRLGPIIILLGIAQVFGVL